MPELAVARRYQVSTARLISVVVFVVLIAGSSACGGPGTKHQQRMYWSYKEAHIQGRRDLCNQVHDFSPEIHNTLVSEQICGDSPLEEWSSFWWSRMSRSFSMQ